MYNSFVALFGIGGSSVPNLLTSLTALTSPTTPATPLANPTPDIVSTISSLISSFAKTQLAANTTIAPAIVTAALCDIDFKNCSAEDGPIKVRVENCSPTYCLLKIGGAFKGEVDFKASKLRGKIFSSGANYKKCCIYFFSLQRII